MITVIIPTVEVSYDNLAITLKSIEMQKLEDAIVTHIIYDGDNPSFLQTCRQLAEEFTKRNTYLVFQTPARRSGPSLARNIGFQAAKTKYAFFLDSGDFIDEHCLSSLLSSLEKGSNAYALGACHFSDGQVSAVRNPRHVFEVASSQTSGFSDPFAYVITSVHPLMVSSEAFRAIGGFDQTRFYGEMTDLLLRLVAGFGASESNVVDDARYHYFRSCRSVSTNVEAMMSARLEILTKYVSLQDLPLSNPCYVGRCRNTGFQIFSQEYQGRRFLPQFICQDDPYLIV